MNASTRSCQHPLALAILLFACSSNTDGSTAGAGGVAALGAGGVAGTAGPVGTTTGGAATSSGGATGASGSTVVTPGNGGVIGAGGAAAGGGSNGGTVSNGGTAGAGVGGTSGGGSPSGGTSGSGAAGASGAGGDAMDCPMSQNLPVGDHTYTIMSANGLTYDYIIAVPKSAVPGKKTPVNVVWHALSSSPEEARMLTDLDAQAEAHGTITVYPRSPDKSWDAGSCCTATAGGKRRDETVFAKELVKDFESKICVDTKRVYTSGFSNGGMISQMLACKMSDVFAAAAPMGSTLTIAKTDCQPTRPIPIYMINGTADPLVGYNAPGFAGGISVPDDFKNWAALNKCTDTPQVTLIKGMVTCSTYKQCAGGVEVTSCVVQGMGHCMPGMKKESATNCLTKSGIALGPPNDDIDGIQVSDDFLVRWALP